MDDGATGAVPAARGRHTILAEVVIRHDPLVLIVDPFHLRPRKERSPMPSSADYPNPARDRGALRWLLFAFTGLLGLNIGAGLFATVVIFPVWSASPEAAVEWQRVVDEARFFVAVAPLVLVLAVAMLVASWWADREVRWWMRMAAVSFCVFFAVTMAYFVPQQAALQGEAAALLGPQDLSASLQRWIRLNWARQVVGLFAFASALHALGLSYVARRARGANDPSLHEAAT